MFRGDARDSSLLPSDFTLDPALCFTRLACHVCHVLWILLRVNLHASWNMRFSTHQHSWVKPLLHRRLSLYARGKSPPSGVARVLALGAPRGLLEAPKARVF